MNLFLIYFYNMSTITNCICGKTTLSKTNNKDNITLPCNHTFHNSCIKQSIAKAPIDNKICPVCMKFIPHLISDHFHYLSDNQRQKYLNLNIENDLFVFKKYNDHDNQFEIDGYHYSNLCHQLTTTLSADNVTIKYIDLNNISMHPGLMNIKTFQNGQKVSRLYIIKSDEDPNHFIFIDEFLKFLILTQKIDNYMVDKITDNMGNVYYTTSENYPLRKYIDIMNTTIGLVQTTYLTTVDMPYLNQNYIDTYHNRDNYNRDTHEQNVKEYEYNIRVSHAISDLVVCSLIEFIEKGIEIDIDTDTLIRIFTVASVYNVFGHLGYSEFNIREDFLNNVLDDILADMGTVENEEQIRHMFTTTYSKKIKLTHDIFLPMFIPNEKDRYLLDHIIDEQQQYIDNFVDINHNIKPNLDANTNNGMDVDIQHDNDNDNDSNVSSNTDIHIITNVNMA